MSTTVRTPAAGRRLREPDLDAWIRSGAWRDLPESNAPALPALATEILELAADPDVSQVKVANAVSKDPVLATRILGLANSAASAAAVTITSINEAILRLGTRIVCNVALADRMAGGFQDQRIYGPFGQTLRDHSIGTAYVAYLVADTAGLPSDEAFLCGLMHDIGKLYVLKLVHDVGLPSPTGKPSASTLRLVTDTHAEVGGFLIQKGDCPRVCRIRSSGTTSPGAPPASRAPRPSPMRPTASPTATASVSRGTRSTIRSPTTRCRSWAWTSPRWPNSTRALRACTRWRGAGCADSAGAGDPAGRGGWRYAGVSPASAIASRAAERPLAVHCPDRQTSGLSTTSTVNTSSRPIHIASISATRLTGCRSP